jgi:hypothetical protein
MLDPESPVHTRPSATSPLLACYLSVTSHGYVNCNRPHQKLITGTLDPMSQKWLLLFLAASLSMDEYDFDGDDRGGGMHSHSHILKLYFKGTLIPHPPVWLLPSPSLHRQCPDCLERMLDSIFLVLFSSSPKQFGKNVRQFWCTRYFQHKTSSYSGVVVALTQTKYLFWGVWESSLTIRW